MKNNTTYRIFLLGYSRCISPLKFVSSTRAHVDLHNFCAKLSVTYWTAVVGNNENNHQQHNIAEIFLTLSTHINTAPFCIQLTSCPSSHCASVRKHSAKSVSFSHERHRIPVTIFDLGNYYNTV